MSSKSIFYENWRDCLRAHYMHVIKQGDQVTEPTLHNVLLSVGFTETEIKEMAITAKMRDTDATPDDLPTLE
jgi:hypothetical protein